ncbi:MAG TPA: CFI-box-CTERM domain-containing protein [Nitrosarchaeum sp.]
MKLYFLIIFIGLIVFVPNFVDARPPPRDLDWPAREYFTMDNYPGLDGEKEYWQQYYDFKGKDWMEEKKKEMLDAYNNGTLAEWTSISGPLKNRNPDSYSNNPNLNVWFYYWINNEIPHYYSQDIFPTSTRDSLQKCKLDRYVLQCYVGNGLILSDSTSPRDGCLIATASYGSELAPQVQMLREIRDNTLLNTESGKIFMNGFNSVYYLFSPQVAQLENENPIFKETVKVFITPMITTLSIMTLAEDSDLQVITLGISTIGLIIGMYIVAPVVLVWKVGKIITSNHK